MLDYVWQKFDYAKASLLAYVGGFLQLQKTLLDMRDHADAMIQMGQDKGDADLVRSAQDFRDQVQADLDKDADLQTQALQLKARVDEIDAQRTAPAPTSAGQGEEILSAGVILGVVAAAGVLIAAMEIHWRHVNYLKGIEADLVAGKLTQAEAAMLVGGDSLGFPSFSSGILMGGAALGLLLWYASRRRKRGAR